MMTMMTMIIVRVTMAMGMVTVMMFIILMLDCVDILGQTCRPRRIVKVKVVLPLKP